MPLFNWGQESPEQKAIRAKLEEEALYEQAARAGRSRGNSNATANSGGAAGSGGITPPAIDSQIIITKEVNSANWKYRILDYTNIRINGSYDTGVPIEDYYLNGRYIVTGKGYMLEFRGESDANQYILIFIDSKSKMVRTISGTSSDLNVYSMEGRWIVAHDYDLSTIWYFDGNKVYEDTTTLSGDIIYYQFGSNDRSTNLLGFGVYKAVPTTNGLTYEYYILNETGATFMYTYEYDSTSGDPELNITPYLYDFSDYLVIQEYNNTDNCIANIKFISSDQTITTIPDITPGAYTNFDLNYYGTNKSVVVLYNENDSSVNYINAYYDGATSTLFSDNSISRNDYATYEISCDYRGIADMHDYAFSEGAIIAFYTDSGNNYNFNMFEPSICKFIVSFNGEEPRSVDFLTGDGQLVAISDIWTPNAFTMPCTDAAGDFHIISLADDPDKDLNISYRDYVETNNFDVEYFSVGDKIILFLQTAGDTAAYVIRYDTYMANAIDLSFEGALQDIDHRYSSDSFTFNINGQEWYINASATEWTEIDYYPESRGPRSFVSPLNEYPGILLQYRVPTRIFWFNDSGNDFISDGGQDMYDEGNYISTNYSSVPYTHTQMNINNYDEAVLSDFIMDGQVTASDSIFGNGSHYFTNLYPGLFVLVTTGADINTFTIDGGLGSDGSVTNEIYEFAVTHNSKPYTVFVKREWNDTPSGEPSVNHIIITQNDNSLSPAITQDASDGSADTDFHVINGPIPSTLHYMVVSKTDRVKLTDTEVTNLVANYLNVVDPVGSNYSIDNILTALNANYSLVTAALPQHTNVVNARVITKTGMREFQISYFENLIRVNLDGFVTYFGDPDREYKITFNVYNLNGVLKHQVKTNDTYVNDTDSCGHRSYAITQTKEFTDQIYSYNSFHLLSARGTSVAHNKTLWDNNAYRYDFNDYAWWD